jgi:hypothetical protein
VTVTFDPFHGAPMSLVERAVVLADKRKRMLRRTNADVPFDEIWCVFDRDEHPFVDEAIELATRNGIGVAFSNPCFELWFVLHARDLRRHTDRHKVQAMSAKLGFTTGKSLAPDAWPKLQLTWKEAQQRNSTLTLMHSANGSPLISNPATSVGHLVQRLHDTD